MVPEVRDLAGLPGDRRRVEYRSIHAHAFHRRALRSIDLYGTPGAAADGARHEFLERDLARQRVASRELGDRFEHRSGAAGKNFDHPEFVLRQ